MQQTNGQILTDLLTPLHVAYTEAEAAERTRKLQLIYDKCAKDPEIRALFIEITRRSFWAHLALLLFTHDEKAIKYTYKPFAPLACYKTIADFLDQREPDGTWAHPVIAIDKSRQLMLSWLMICRLDWLAIHRQHSYCPVIGKTDPDGKALLQRIRTLHDYYPAWYVDEVAVRGAVKRSGFIQYSNNSMVQALAQRGGHAIRSRVPSMALYDEAAFQESFEKNWTGAKGTCDSRTQLMAVTTATPSHFQQLIEDRLDGKHGGRETTHHSSTGLEIWTNQFNLVDCIRLHYRADPARRTAKWKRQAIRGMAMWQWNQEMEIDYSARGGKPIFKMLDRNVHVTDGHIEVVPLGKGWGIRIEGYNDAGGHPIVRPVRLLRMIDHGTTNYCAAVWVAVDEDLDWFIYRTYKRTGWFAPENAASIAKASWCEEADRYEHYTHNVIDAMQGLPDKRGKVEDLYRQYTDERGRKPLFGLEAVTKGVGSRQEGLDSIAAMLHSTMAVCAPEHPYWEQEGYEADHRRSFQEHSSIYLGRDVAEPLFEELEKARWDEPTNPDPEMEQPETSLKMMDDLIDCLRYGIRAATPMMIRQVQRDVDPD